MKQINLQEAKALLCSAGLLFAVCTVGAQTQKGADIEGQSAGDLLGYSVMMPDSKTIAIGAPLSDGNGIEAGQVRVFGWNGSSWVQKGSDINGDAAGDRLGFSVAMPDANTLAIGATRNDGNGIDAGQVRVFSWNGSSWVQKGSDINGDAADDRSGASVTMPDANTLAIGAPFNDKNGIDAGQVRVFSWNGSSWVQKGPDINGDAADDRFGYFVTMPDTNTPAVGAPFNDKNGTDAGQVRVFSWNGIAWVQKGLGADGEAANDNFGLDICMPDTNTLAVGTIYNDRNGTDAGYVRVFSWNGSAWIQKGSNIYGEEPGDYFGSSISMPDSNILAVGVPGNDGSAMDAGQIIIFKWNGTTWYQTGLDIYGEGPTDASGFSFSMPDSNTIASGAPLNDGNGIDAGHVRVYTLDSKSKVKNSFGSAFRAYPNPTPGELNIDLGSVYPAVAVIARNALGQVVMHQSFSDIKTLQLNIPGEAGLYMVEINSNDKKALLKVMKK